MSAVGRAGAAGGAGPTVVVTRPRAKAGPMVAALRERGFEVILAPSVRIAPPQDPRPFHRALRKLDHFDWVVLTSASGAEAVARAREAWVERPPAPSEKGLPGGLARPPAPRRLAVVGASTARAAERRLGWAVDLMPDQYTAEALLEALEREVEGLNGTTMLLPLAEAARELLPRGLEARGARVTRVTAYRTVAADGAELDALREILDGGGLDLLTFTSPSTAERFLEAVGRRALEVPAAVIGPVTAAAAAGLGYQVAAVAEEHTVEGLVAAAEAVLLRPSGDR